MENALNRFKVGLDAWRDDSSAECVLAIAQSVSANVACVVSFIGVAGPALALLFGGPVMIGIIQELLRVVLRFWGMDLLVASRLRILNAGDDPASRQSARRVVDLSEIAGVCDVERKVLFIVSLSRGSLLCLLEILGNKRWINIAVAGNLWFTHSISFHLAALIVEYSPSS